MDRSIAPEVKQLQDFDYLKAKTKKLDNGLSLFYIANNKQEAVKVDLVFPAGYAREDKALQAAAVADLLKEGSRDKTAEELAEAIEKEGAFMTTAAKADFIELSLYCLASKLDALLPLVKEMIEAASFPEAELETFLENKKQKFSIQEQKVDFMVKNEFLASIFGEEHPYNNKIQGSDFNQLHREDLLSFYNAYIKNKKFSLFVSGKITAREIDLLNNSFGQNDAIAAVEDNNDYSYQVKERQERFFEKPNTSQAAIRIGMPCIGKENEDFPALFFTNVLLGGFFGSRLMRNIREEKGYTYGIGSALVNLKAGAYFFIASELGSEYLDATLKEIEKEIQKLKTEKVSDKELRLVKNYLQGNLMKSFDGAFAAMDRFKSLYSQGLDYSYYDQLFAAFKKMSAADIVNAANSYLDYDKFNILVAGKKSNN